MMFKEALNWYKGVKVLSKAYDDNERVEQLESLVKIIEDFPFDSVYCIETGASRNWDDGCVGAFFAKLCQFTNGEFHSVDIDDQIIEESKMLYEELGVPVNHHMQDSVRFLKETNIIPNLVHLDSWDLDLRNPFPSALHGWREFIAIEDKMPVGSILIVDDNYFAAELPTRTWVTWYDDRSSAISGEGSEKIYIDYPIIGKGSNIWHFVESGESNWKILSENIPGPNVKLVYQKVKSS